jgi:hypothetical protein
LNRKSHQPHIHASRLLPLGSRTDSTVTLYLTVTYPPGYPDEIPELALEPIDEESGELRDDEEEDVLAQLRASVRAWRFTADS